MAYSWVVTIYGKDFETQQYITIDSKEKKMSFSPPP